MSVASPSHAGRDASIARWLSHHNAKLTAGGSSPFGPSVPMTRDCGASVPPPDEADAAEPAPSPEVGWTCSVASCRIRRSSGEAASAGKCLSSSTDAARLLSARRAGVLASLLGEPTARGGGRTPKGAILGPAIGSPGLCPCTAACICCSADPAAPAAARRRGGVDAGAGQLNVARHLRLRGVGEAVADELAHQRAFVPRLVEHLLRRDYQIDLVARLQAAAAALGHSLSVDEGAVDRRVLDGDARAAARDALVRREGLLALLVAAEAEALVAEQLNVQRVEAGVERLQGAEDRIVSSLHTTEHSARRRTQTAGSPGGVEWGAYILGREEAKRDT
eukprot:scaffold3416_cov133-Isochrysis_galbana.AAC.9